MDQNISETDLVAQANEAQNMPELLDAFESIEKMKIDDEPVDIVNEINDEPQESIQEEEQEDNELSDASNESQTEEEIVLKSPYREKKADKIRKLQNDKYRALAEKEDALQRLAEMEARLEESLSSGTYHYGKNVYAELDRAKANWQKTFNEGDEAGLMDAQLALIKAQQAVSELETWANQNDNKSYSQNNTNYQNNNYVSPNQFQNNNLVHNNFQSNNSYNPYQESLHQEIANDWLDSHPYLKPQSRSYDPKLAGEVTNFINKLDNNLYRNNDADAIFSEEYFYTIDSYIKTLTASKRDNSRNLEALSNVSGVRNTSSGGTVNKSLPITEVTLTKAEKIMADNAGVSHKQWLKYKIEDLKNNNGVTYGK